MAWSHVVCHLPPNACVHVTYESWKIESKCEESEMKFPLVESKKTIRWKKGKEKKIKEKNKRNEKKKEERKETGGKKLRKNPCVEEKGKRKENDSNSRCSDGRKSLVRELKLVYSTRATSMCQKQKR